MNQSVVRATPDGTSRMQRVPGPQPGIPLDVWWKRLDTTLDGLSEKTAYERLTKYGLNRLDERRRRPFLKFLSFFSGPIAWMIEIAAVLSVLAHHMADFIIVVVLLIFNAVVGFRQEFHAANTIEALKRRLAVKARVKREGKWREVDAAHLVPGDIVRLTPGDIIPADVVLVHGGYLSVDQSALTGASLPVEKKLQDVGYSGAVVKQGEMEAVVTHTGSHTYFGKTAKLVSSSKNASHYRRAVLKIGNYLIYLSLGLAVILMLAMLVRGSSVVTLLQFALILFVAAIPVAMPAVLSVTMTIGAHALAKMKAIVTHLVSIEEMAGIDVLCTDKTGTLTQNKLTLHEPEVMGPTDKQGLILAAALASKGEDHDVIDNAILKHVTDPRLLATNVQEKFIPFDPVRQRAEAVIRADDGSTYRVAKGTPRVMLELCVPESDIEQRATARIHELTEKGYRTLGVARDIGKGWEFLGLLPLYDPARDDSFETIRDLRASGITVKMVTGDSVAIAKQMSTRLGLGTNIHTAEELFGTSETPFLGRSSNERDTAPPNTDLTDTIGVRSRARKDDVSAPAERSPLRRAETVATTRAAESASAVKTSTEATFPPIAEDTVESADGFAQVFPEDKFNIVRALQERGHLVAMTGDGANDAPALKKADAGIAVSGATDAARAAASLVLTTPGLSVILRAVEGARRIFERMNSYAIYRIAETIRILVFVALAMIFFDLYPITSIMIIVLAFLNDLPIITIGYDNTWLEPKPVRWEMRRVLSVSTVLGLVGVVETFGLLVFAKYLLHLNIAQLQSFIFLKLAVAGHLTLLVARTRRPFFTKPYPAPILLAAVIASKLIATLMVGVGLWMAAIPWTDVALVWGYCLVWVFVEDWAKLGVYRRLEAARA